MRNLSAVLSILKAGLEKGSSIHQSQRAYGAKGSQALHGMGFASALLAALALGGPMTQSQGGSSEQHGSVGAGQGASPKLPTTGEDVYKLPVEKLYCHRAAEGPTSHRQAVLVAAGSFNPPTFMHLRMLELARDALTLRGYNVIGAYMSPVHDGYGKAGLAPAAHRIRMCQLATQDSPYIMVDQWEASQLGPQRTLHVLEHMDESMNANWKEDEEKVEVMLVCGADLLESLSTPGVWIDEQVKTMCSRYGIVCIAREGTSARAAIQKNDILFRNQKNILVIDDWNRNDVSSSKVRKNISRGQSVRYLLPESVRLYIKEHGMYDWAPNHLRD